MKWIFDECRVPDRPITDEESPVLPRNPAVPPELSRKSSSIVYSLREMLPSVEAFGLWVRVFDDYPWRIWDFAPCSATALLLSQKLESHFRNGDKKDRKYGFTVETDHKLHLDEDAKHRDRRIDYLVGQSRNCWNQELALFWQSHSAGPYHFRVVNVRIEYAFEVFNAGFGQASEMDSERT